MDVSEGGEKRPNFSAIGPNNSNLIKMPSNGAASKPGDIRKLVIKNFKGKQNKCMRQECQ